METFFGRKEELELLDRIYSEEKLKSCAIYGRRRIGKTSLLKKFCSNKKSIYIQFAQAPFITNLDIIDEEIKKIDKTIENKGIVSAFNNIIKIAKKEKIVVVLDELPYILEAESSASSIIQHFVDTILRETESMVVVCGSSISMMKNEIYNSKKPLYGRFAFKIMLKSFKIDEIRDFHPSASDEDLIKLYLTFGGLTAYHNIVGDTNYKDAINRHVLSKYGFVSSDLINGLFNEIRTRHEETIILLNLISDGYNTYNQLKDLSNLNEKIMMECLNNLINLEIVSKMDSMIESKKSKKYVIVDPITAFYFGIAHKYSGIESEDPFSVLKPKIDTFLGKSFEIFCRNFVKDNYPCEEIGLWWGKHLFLNDDGETTIEETDIDLVAKIVSDKNKIMLFGECKFSKNPCGISVLKKLESRTLNFNKKFNNRLALFSISGFTDEVYEIAVVKNILLFDLDLLLKKKKLLEIT